jgi:putative transcriptional regulator
MSSSNSLTGRLLVATPLLRDPNFDRAVVLVLSHDDDGALGVIVNRPTTVPVTDILPNWEPVVTEPGVVFQGGPVSLDSALGLVAVIDGVEPLGVRRVSGQVGVVQPGVVAMRVFAGYAGWSPEQLENEIAEGSWYVVDSQTGDAFSDDANELWKAVLRRQDGPLALMATFPADPSLN